MLTSILLVEGEESLAPTLLAMLQDEGYAVERAATTPEALARIGGARFDGLLLDVPVGEADALAVFKRLKQISPDAVGIVLTGSRSLADAVDSMRAGADDFLLKPLDASELKASLARAFQRRLQVRARNAELAQVSDLLAEAQHLAQLGSWDWDFGRDRMIWSDELYRIFGVSPQDFTPTFAAFLERVHPDDRDRVRAVMRAARDDGKPFDFEHRIVRPDGATRILHGRGKVIVDDAGHGVRLLKTAQDITEQTQAEAGRRRLTQVQTARARAEERVAQLEELDRLKEDFLMTVSHDLKSPLTSIRGNAQLMVRHLRTPTPSLEKVTRALAVIDRQAAAMARLLDDLLDAARIQGGVLDLRTARCALAESLDNVLARLNPGERERVDVRLPDAPLIGAWEQKRIEQVLANLVGNALKYSPDGERVSISVEQASSEIQVAIRDRGMGIAPEELDQLFERFHRTPQAHASSLPGTGLGLYICRGIVEAHGGRIWAESPGEGQGAIFQFTLPLAPPESK